MLKFYPIIDTSIVHISKIEDVAKTIIQAGARIIQLRAKDVSTRDFIDTARIIKQTIKPIAKKNKVKFIINDRVDIAMLICADGVHLGQDDLTITEARKILGNNKIIGISTHNIKEAAIAEKLGADYISFGPIFATSTKGDAQKAKGIDGLKKAREAVRIPIAAIGGITLENAIDVYKAGADCIAVISDILKADDIKDRVSKFISL
ncbi:MAG: thiamine phosphate synthase [Deltaproteobacteria bacterium]|nr:thiamine phosphate synthase [Deltaproteobacteria bacterium]